MKLTPDVLVPVLVALLVVNAFLIVGTLVAGRRSRRRAAAMASAASTAAAEPAATSAAATGLVYEAASDVPPEPPRLTPAHGTTPVRPGGRDPQTGLADAVSWSRLVDDEDPRIRRYRRPVAIVLIELHPLERLIDRLGDEAADRLLPAMADTLRRLAREADHVARLGPARFGVLMPETNEIAAINYVERIRRACELWLESGAVALRLAIGWADTTGDTSLVETQRIAAERMFDEIRRLTRRDTDLVERSTEDGSTGTTAGDAPAPGPA
jgi:diguanylate cyclase (GGDEF)-like protein